MGLSSKQVVSGVGDLQDWPNLQPEPIKAPQLQPATTTAQKRQAMVLDPAPPALRCPRCDSTNTKFCYYNNYSRTQPRYLCKACKRHWTSGGTLRNVPVGGSRKTKRPRTAPTSDAAATTKCGISINANNNGSSSPPSSSILHQPAPIVQHPFLPYSSLMDVPELDYLGGGGSALTGTSGAANLAHLFSLPPLSLPFSTAALGSFLDLASNSCSGGDASFATTPSLSPFFPFIMQPDTSSTTAAALVTDVSTSDPVSNAPSSAWQSTTTGLLLPIVSADDSSSPNVLSPPIASGSASGSCGGMMMTAPWIDDFAGLISTYQQPQDYHHL